MPLRPEDKGGGGSAVPDLAGEEWTVIRTPRLLTSCMETTFAAKTPHLSSFNYTRRHDLSRAFILFVQACVSDTPWG